MIDYTIHKYLVQDNTSNNYVLNIFLWPNAIRVTTASAFL